MLYICVSILIIIIPKCKTKPSAQQYWILQWQNISILLQRIEVIWLRGMPHVWDKVAHHINSIRLRWFKTNCARTSTSPRRTDHQSRVSRSRASFCADENEIANTTPGMCLYIYIYSVSTAHAARYIFIRCRRAPSHTRAARRVT